MNAIIDYDEKFHEELKFGGRHLGIRLKSTSEEQYYYFQAWRTENIWLHIKKSKFLISKNGIIETSTIPEILEGDNINKYFEFYKK